jgi:hypothetical protein
MGTLINDCDAEFLDCIAQESVELVGTIAVIYQFQEEESEIDPLWQEEVTTVYKEDVHGNVGIECPVFFKSPDRSALMGEEGFRLNKTSTLEIAVADLRKRNIEKLRVGDIVKLWTDQYYDVVESHSTEGQISDSGRSTMYSFDVVRRSKGVPESFWRPGEDNG